MKLDCGNRAGASYSADTAMAVPVFKALHTYQGCSFMASLDLHLPPGQSKFWSIFTFIPLNVPRRQFGVSAPVNRSFQAAWFNRFKWLHYDVGQDAAYCFLYGCQRKEN